MSAGSGYPATCEPSAYSPPTHRPLLRRISTYAGTSPENTASHAVGAAVAPTKTFAIALPERKPFASKKPATAGIARYPIAVGHNQIGSSSPLDAPCLR